MNSLQTPVAYQRLLAPDLARGVMLLLIAMAYAGVYVGAGFGTDSSHEPALDQAASFFSTMVLDNRAFPMFAILFGYGLAWSLARRSARGAEPRVLRRGLRRRALLLLAFGAVHAILVFPGEILMSYGLAILLTGGLLFRSDRALRVVLWITGIFYLLVVPLMMVFAQIGEETAAEQQAIPGYTTLNDWIDRTFGVPFGPMFIAVGYPLLFLVVLGYLAGRARLFEDVAAHRGLLLTVACGGVGVSLIGALPSSLIAVGTLEPGALGTGMLLGLQTLTGVAGGAGYAACFALGSQAVERALPAITTAIAAVGKRSLTFYIFNSIVVALLLHPELIGVGAVVGHFGALVVAVLTWAVSVAWASLLERRGQAGPLEVLMRRGINGRPPGSGKA